MSQSFLKKLHRKTPRNYARLIASNAVGISPRRVYAVVSKSITNPEIIFEVEQAAEVVWNKFYAKKIEKSSIKSQ